MTVVNDCRLRFQPRVLAIKELIISSGVIPEDRSNRILHTERECLNNRVPLSLAVDLLDCNLLINLVKDPIDLGQSHWKGVTEEVDWIVTCHFLHMN